MSELDQTLNSSLESSTEEVTQDVDSSTTDGTQEAESSTAEAEKPQTVPFGRLEKEIARRKSLEERLAQLEQQQTREDEPKHQERKTDDEPPEHLSPREKVRWYVERDAGSLIERQLGMSLDQARRLLAGTPNVANDYAERKWRDYCGRFELDPEASDVQDFVVGLYRASKDRGQEIPIEDLFKRAQKIFGKAAPPQKANGNTEAKATVENQGLTGVMSRERVIPRDRKEAGELARKGVRVPNASMEEIFASRRSQKKG